MAKERGSVSRELHGDVTEGRDSEKKIDAGISEEEKGGMNPKTTPFGLLLVDDEKIRPYISKRERAQRISRILDP